ncbi:MAG: TIGR00268 family protein, partial [bacterium]
MIPELEAQAARLRAAILPYGSVLVAYSGGVDSALVLKAAVDALGPRALGVIGVSPSLSPEDLDAARSCARAMGAALRELRTAEFEDERYAANAPDRCYFCKSELYGRLAALAAAEGFAVVADGFHLDDLGDVRPGQRAGGERGVRSPLKDAGFRKADV